MLRNSLPRYVGDLLHPVEAFCLLRIPSYEQGNESMETFLQDRVLGLMSSAERTVADVLWETHVSGIFT